MKDEDRTRLARKNELKARGTLLMALPNKHQLKFNIHKDAKTLIEVIEKRFGGNKETKKVQRTLLKQQYENFTGSSSKSLDQIHDRLQKLITQLEILKESLSQKDINLNLKIYEAEVKSSSSASTSTQNIAFVSSQTTDNTNEPVIVVASVSVASTKLPVFALPNQIDADDLEEMDLKWQMAMLTVECYNCHRKGHFARECRSPKDTRRNVAAEPQRRNVPVETSTSNALVSQCDGVGSYDWSFQAEEEPTNYALMAFTSSSSSSFDNEVASCLKACTKAYATLQSHYDRMTNDLTKSQCDVISYETGLESIEARLLVYQQNETVFEEDIKLLKLDVQLRDNALVVLRQNFEKVEQEKDKMFSYETDESLPTSPKYDRYQSGEGYHAIPPPYTGTFMPSKPDLVFHDAFNVNETVHAAFNVELSPIKPDKDLSHRPSAPIIEDWVSNSEDDSEAELLQNAPSFVQNTEQVKTPRSSVKPVENSIPDANHKTTIPKPKSHGNSRNRKACFVFTTAKAPMVNVVNGVNGNWIQVSYGLGPKETLTFFFLVHGNPHHAFKDKGVIDSGCSRHMIGNMSYLSNFEEINGGYVAFGGNPKGGKISGKESLFVVGLRGEGSGSRGEVVELGWKVGERLKFCAGEGGLKSWERCGGGGVEGKTGE
nr:hypothetical protein [Tanacetum cinerariifolium]